MKKIALLAIISIFNFQLSILQAQQTYYIQEVPYNVNEIRLEGSVRLIVKSTDGHMALQTLCREQVASVKNGRLTIPDSRYDVILLLPEGRSMTFNVEDHAYLLFQGSFGKRQQLTINTEDYASANFSGSLADSMWAVTLNLRAEDHSQINSEIRQCCFHFYFVSNDYARISLACQQEKYEEGFESRVQSISIDDNAHIDYVYCHGDSVEPFKRENQEIVRITQEKLNEVKANERASGNEKKRSFWRWRDVELHFAWGFHNWGSDMWSGFEGVDGDAAIRTSFNNIQLSVNYPLVGTRHLGLFVGLGLEWDKYKFNGNDITFSATPNPYTFVDGGDPTCSSWLNTRYVVVPLTLKFYLWHDWSLSLAALPGIHWSGSHTGLRREYDTDLEERTDYDQSVNRFINPYKLDLRATLSYESIGLYLQVPTMSTFRNTVQDLYPIKFGLYWNIFD